MDGSGWEYLERYSEDYDKHIEKLNKQIERLQEQLAEANELIKDYGDEYPVVVKEYLEKWGVK